MPSNLKQSTGKIFFFVAMIVVLSVLTASPALADTFTIDNPIGSDTFEQFINKITLFVFWIAIALAPLMVIFSAFYFITANGDPGKVKKAKDILIYTAIGIGIALLSRGFVSMVINVL